MAQCSNEERAGVSRVADRGIASENREGETTGCLENGNATKGKGLAGNETKK